jgi:hypothetical protein
VSMTSYCTVNSELGSWWWQSRGQSEALGTQQLPTSLSGKAIDPDTLKCYTCKKKFFLGGGEEQPEFLLFELWKWF